MPIFKIMYRGYHLPGADRMDFSKPGAYQKSLDSGIWKDKCVKYVEFRIEKLYGLENDKGLFVQAP